MAARDRCHLLSHVNQGSVALLAEAVGPRRNTPSCRRQARRLRRSPASPRQNELAPSPASPLFPGEVCDIPSTRCLRSRRANGRSRNRSRRCGNEEAAPTRYPAALRAPGRGNERPRRFASVRPERENPANASQASPFVSGKVPEGTRPRRGRRTLRPREQWLRRAQSARIDSGRRGRREQSPRRAAEPRGF